MLCPAFAIVLFFWPLQLATLVLVSDAGSPVPSAYLYADPAAHSLSPAMHRAAFRWAGLPGEYEARRVSAQALPEHLLGLRFQAHLLGVNLSLPHKEAALPFMDSLSDEARHIGAVNTVVNRGGQLTGHNTDAPGLWHALADADLLGGAGPVVVLGAGGAARSAVYTALISLERDVYVVNRTRQRAEELAAHWYVPHAGFQVWAADLTDIPWSEVSLLINSSSAGLNDATQTPLPEFDWTLCPQAGVYDMVYKPAQTRLIREARGAGLRAENGLGMLAHQARLAFQLWTGLDVPVSVFLDAARDGLG